MIKDEKLRFEIKKAITDETMAIDGAMPQIVTERLYRILENAPSGYIRPQVMAELRQMELEGYIKQDATHTFYFEDASAGA